MTLNNFFYLGKPTTNEYSLIPSLSSNKGILYFSKPSKLVYLSDPTFVAKFPLKTL